jgi:hypothetical protein
MNAMMWIVLVAALILAAGGVAYFEAALRHNVFLQPSQPFPDQRDVSREAESKAQSASVNTPAPAEVALRSSALPHCETHQNQS